MAQVRNIAPAKSAYRNERLTIIITAAGAGRKTRGFGPKSLLPTYDGVLLVESQVYTLQRAYPRADIVMVVGFEADKVREVVHGRLPVRLVHNPQYETTNVVYSVSLGLDASLPGSVIVLHGDMAFNKAAIHGLAGEASAILVDATPGTKVGAGVSNGYVTHMSHAIKNTQWGQMAYLTGKELVAFRKVVMDTELSKGWMLYEVLEGVIRDGGKFRAHQPHDMRVVEINKHSDLKNTRGIT